jgi:hypothetical protein
MKGGRVAVGSVVLLLTLGLRAADQAVPVLEFRPNAAESTVRRRPVPHLIN